MKDVVMGSEWQNGPNFLELERKDWPLSRDFRTYLPDKEMTVPVVHVGLINVAEKTKTLRSILKTVMERTNNLDKAIGVVARLMRVHCQKDRSAVVQNPSGQEREAARKLLIWASMGPTRDAYQAGKLQSLGISVQGGVYVMSGRCVKNLKALVGQECLPVLMPGTRLARLLMIQAHEESHSKDPRDVMGRVRGKAWIVRGRQVALSVIKSCNFCRLKSTKQAEQIMAQIPSFAFHPCPPFTHTALDFFGPFTVRGMGNSRVTHRSWGLLYVCLNTKAVKILATGGYPTNDFLIAHKKFVSNCGAPALTVSDQGSQLQGARRVTGAGDPAGVDWRKIE